VPGVRVWNAGWRDLVVVPRLMEFSTMMKTSMMKKKHCELQHLAAVARIRFSLVSPVPNQSRLTSHQSSSAKD